MNTNVIIATEINAEFYALAIIGVVRPTSLPDARNSNGGCISFEIATAFFSVCIATAEGQLA